MKLVPLFDKVVLKQLVAEETTKSGIVLPGAAKEKPQQAEVIAVGPGGVVDGKEITMQVKAGDKVIYSKYSGTEVEVEDEKYVIVKQSDILAVVELSLIHIYLNPNSLTVLHECYVEPALAEGRALDSYQFVRNGFFCVDCKDSTPEHPVFNRIVSLKSSFKLPK